jgi:F-type H+-transporting ATPase subunit delta
MLIYEVARKYAQALFLSAQEKKLLDTVYEQLGDLKELMEKDRTLLNFLGAPQVLEATKKEMVRKVFGERIERLLVEFLLVLLDKGRVGFLVEIIDEFERLVEAEQGVGRVTVVTAVALSDSERTRLSERMAAKTGLNIVLEEKVDKSIIGGMIVVLHDEIIDGSVRHGLGLIREQLDKVRVH